MTETKKVLITGAAGQIGYALSFNVARGDLGNFQVKLFLLDIEQCTEKLEGIRMELLDSCFPNLESVEYGNDIPIMLIPIMLFSFLLCH